MPGANEDYASYLLRFHRVQGVSGFVWTASVQSTASGELRRFANLEALVEFLLGEFGEGEGTKPTSQLAVQNMPGPRRS
jgi:hypothetical protein